MGMVICVPEGNSNKTASGFPEDGTRLPEYYDSTYQYLKSIGIKELPDKAEHEHFPNDVTVTFEGGNTATTTAPSAPTKEKEDYSKVTVGTAVIHGKFGDGNVVKIDKVNSYVIVAFSVGEKVFAMPDCFQKGYLELP